MYLLYISPTNLEVYRRHQKVGEVAWNTDNLSDSLSRLKSTFSSRFRVILSDSFITVASLLLSPKESKKRANIQSKFQPLFKHDLNQTVWDYKIVSRFKNQLLVQVVVVDSVFFNPFRQAVATAKIKINLLESFSTSLSHLLPKKKLIFLHYQDLLVLVFNRTPIFSQVLTTKFSQENIDFIFTYSKERFNTLPQQILFSPPGDIAFNQFDFSGLSPEYTTIDPLKGITHSPNLHGSDATTSRLEIKPQSAPAKFPKSILITPLLLLLIGIGVIFKFNYSSNFSNSSPSPTPSPISPTPTVIPNSAIKIQVLNGSGQAGQAGIVADLLTKNNFIVTDTGNAANFKYDQTQIQTKSSVPVTVVAQVTQSLQPTFNPQIITEKLPNSSEYDIIITTGK
jgi:hypothetical protein